MNPDKKVWVQVRPVVVRIFRSFRAANAAAKSEDIQLALMPYADAVKSLRHTLFLRSDNHCEQCEAPITEKQAHMHERQHRGKGGEISLENSILICAACHKFDHRDRNPKFQRRVS